MCSSDLSDAQDDGNTASFTLNSGDINMSLDAGFNKQSSIGNFVWHDYNGNGVQDDGDASGLAAISVSLYDDKNMWLSTTTTNASGYYLFTGLKAAKYIVGFGSAGTDFQLTDRNLGGNDANDSDPDPKNGKTTVVTLNPGQFLDTLDAGYYKMATIGDLVWVDSNKNGVRDSGELGRSGVTVTLSGTDGRGTTITPLTTTTASDGSYSFSVRPGTYTVKVTLPTGFVATTRGTDPSKDDDSNIYSNGSTDPVTVRSGESNRTIDAGIIQSATGSGDLQITKSDGYTTLVGSQQVTYTIVVTNIGGSTITNAQVSDIIPANLSNVSWTVSSNGAVTRASNAISGTGNINDQITSIAANASLTYLVTGTVVAPGLNTSSSTSTFNLASTTDGCKSGVVGNSRT